MLQRVKEVQESDLRMVGALARNIQRVLAVTQADIDAAAAQGKGWLVKRVVKVNDPLDNLRGGTQLVIKQNSIQPGQNVMRVLYSGNSKTVGPAVAPLSLPGAAAEDIMSLIAFGGTEQGGVPIGYKALNGITNGSGTYIDTGITPTVDNVEIELRVKPTTGSWYILQSRASGSAIWGVSGSSSGATILLGWGGTGTLCQSSITRDPTHTYYVKATMNNGIATLYVKDETADTEDTKTSTYTSSLPSLPFWLYGNQNYDRVIAGNTVYMARIKIGGVTVMDYVPALNPSMVVGFYDKVTGNFKVSNEGTLTADQTIVPTPSAPMDIVCNNGVLKARHQSGLPTGYTLLDYIESTGTQYIDLGVKGNENTKVSVEYRYHTATGATGSGRVFGSRTTSSNNAFAIGTSSGVVSATGNKAFWCYDAQSFFVIDDPTFPIGDWQTVVFSATEHTLNGVSYGDDYNVVAFETPQNLKLFGFDNGGTMGYGQVDIARCKLWDNGVLIRDLVPCKNASNVVGMYDLVNDAFYQNAGTGDFVVGTAVSDPVEIYTAGPIETITIKDDQDTTVSTATCEDLLSVGTYTDEQEVISGVVTRKVGVKVLDGTENIGKSSQYAGSFFVRNVVQNWGTSNGAEIICSHFSGVTEESSYAQNKCIVLNNAFNMWWASDNTPTLAQFTQWLADQYAAGTPVIVIYPLATATTESVTGQPMQTAAGDNTAEITQAGMAGLELEVEYVEA